MNVFITLVLYTWFIALLLQLVSAPVLLVKTKKLLIDGGWGFGRILSWLTLSLVIWFAGNLRLPANQSFVIYTIFFFCLFLSLVFLWRHRQEIKPILSRAWHFILIEETLFLLGLLILSFIRAHNPAILDLEKFMDAGFMASYLRSPTLPAPDMWLAGETINYYSFGHFMGSIFTQLLNLEIGYAYNLILGLILGLSLIQSFSFVVNLLYQTLPSKKISSVPLIFGGMVGAFLVNIGGNTHTIWYLLKNRSWSGYWYADATRFIERTIHEFPSYSFVVSDLHGHVWDLPVVTFFLLILLLWLKRITPTKPSKSLLLLATTLGILYGVMGMTNMWDLLIYGLIICIVAAYLFVQNPRYVLPLLISAALALLGFTLTILPWFLNFTSISEGAAIATEHSPLWQLFVLWTGHVLISALGLWLASRLILKQNQKLQPSLGLFLVTAMILTAWILLILPEVVYIKDIYTGHPRANTMFKLTYQAFILMSLTGGWVLGVGLAKALSKGERALAIILSLTLVAVVAPFPYFAYRDYYGHLNDFKTLNGHAWFKEQFPNDYKLMRYLAKNVKGQPVILEAVGESYTTFARMSAATGIPTVLGWRVHEWLWRGGFDIPGQRTTEVETMYTRPFSPEAQALFNQYQVEYIVVGEKEYEAYASLNSKLLEQLGEVIFREGRSVLVHRDPVAPAMVNYSSP